MVKELQKNTSLLCFLLKTSALQHLGPPNVAEPLIGQPAGFTSNIPDECLLKVQLRLQRLYTKLLLFNPSKSVVNQTLNEKALELPRRSNQRSDGAQL